MPRQIPTGGTTLVSPDGQWLIRLGDDALEARRADGTDQARLDGVKLWSTGSFAGRAVAVMSPVPAIASQRAVVATAAPGQVLRWDLDGGEVERWSLDGDVVEVAITPDGERLAALDDRGALTVIDRGGSTRRLADGVARGALRFAGDGRHLAVSGSPARIFEVETGAEPARARGEIAAFSPDGRWLALAGERSPLTRCELATRRCQPLLGGDHAALVVVANDGLVVAVPDQTAVVTSWAAGAATGRVVGRHRSAIRALVLSPDARALVSAGDGPEARLWDLASGEGRLLRGELAEPVFLGELAGFTPSGAVWLHDHQSLTTIADELPRDEAGLRAAIEAALTGR